MTKLLSLAAPVALILSNAGFGLADPPAEGPQLRDIRTAATGVETDPMAIVRSDATANQVRIERRVTIRISPRRIEERGAAPANLISRTRRTRMREIAMEPCVPVARISGVQTGRGNRLLLFLDDERIVGLNLERNCRAREFYSGFYMERTKDGRLCVDRDRLQSRSGAQCGVERMRQLVPVDD